MKKIAIIGYTMAVLLIGGAMGQLVQELDASQYCGRCRGHGVECDLEIIDENTLEVRVYQPHMITTVAKVNSSDTRVFIAK